MFCILSVQLKINKLIRKIISCNSYKSKNKGIIICIYVYVNTFSDYLIKFYILHVLKDKVNGSV